MDVAFNLNEILKKSHHRRILLTRRKEKKQALAKFRKEFYCGNLLAAEEAAVAYRNRHPLGAGLSEGKFILKIGLKNYLAAFHL